MNNTGLFDGIFSDEVPTAGTHAGKGGQPFATSREAFLSYASTSPGVYTDQATGKAFSSERAMREYQWEHEHGRAY